jgi:hypothetical protein
MKRIKKFDPLSVMKIAAICYAALGLFEGILMAVVFSVIGAGREATGMPRFLAPVFGVFSIFIFPIVFAAAGAIGGGLGAVIYNVGARFVGGIEVEVE